MELKILVFEDFNNFDAQQITKHFHIYETSSRFDMALGKGWKIFTSISLSPFLNEEKQKQNVRA